MLQIGSILERKYKILDVIGKGGMSVIYLARNERANKTWAIKEVRKEGIIDEQANLAGLIAETDMLKQLHHPNIVSIIDVIDYEDSFIIVMDYIEGKDLKKVLEEEGAQDPERVRQWGITICKIFSYLHSQNPPIIYRDMKPNNLMLTSNDDVVLIDFGTARRYKNSSQADDTKPLGTIGYAAPEQYGGHGETDARTDIYTIGATLFHLLTGISPADPPFYGVTLLRNVDPVFEGTGWEYVINKCCQQKREDRYQSCDELMYDLVHVDEFDVDVIAKRKRRWTAFLASVILGLFGVAGMFAFSALKSAASTQTYSALLDRARQEVNIQDAESLYKQALALNPQDSRALMQLYESVRADVKLSGTEIAVLNSVLKSGSPRTYEEVLKDSDRESYDELMYNIGLLYFFGRNNADSDMPKAAKYFEAVLDSKYLSEGEKNLAKSLYTIGTNYQALSTSESYLDGYTYEKFWEDLKEMISGSVAEKVGDSKMAIAVYSTNAYIISQKYQELMASGISYFEFNEQFSVIEKGLQSAPNLKLRDSALKNLEAARKSVDTAFDRKG